MVATRSVEWPTSAATLTAGRAASTAATYAAIVGWTYLSPPPSRLSGGGTSARTSGARLMPQLPTTTVVTPWLIFGSICGAESTIWSSCVCTSMKPGRDDLPVDVDHIGAVRGEIGADRGDAVALDAHVGSEAVAPEPSMTVPPRRSSAGGPSVVLGLIDAFPLRDHAVGSAGCVSVSEPRSFSTWRTRFNWRNAAGTAAQADAHHQDLEVGDLREIGLGADAHREVDRHDDRHDDVGQPGQRRARLRDRDDHRALLLRHLDRVQQAAHGGRHTRSPARRRCCSSSPRR